MKVDYGCHPVRRCALLIFAVVTLMLTVGTATSQASFSRGFADDVWVDPNVNHHLWIRRTVATGAQRALIDVDWSSIESRRPAAGQNASNPAGSQYYFASLDARVKAFRGTGIQPVVLITDAPRWAEGKGGSKALYATGGYRPNAKALGQLAKALAIRYSGHYKVAGKTLPRVRYFQVWAEANLKPRLSPQWVRRHGHWVNVGPLIYRKMLNAFYAGVKAGNRSDQVIASGLEAYGDPPSYSQLRTQPVLFLRNLMCLNSRLQRVCNSKAHFDILASDPYDVGPPTQHAYSPLDASAPDLGRLMRVAHAGVRRGTLLPSSRKQLWVTEFGYDSRPPNPSKYALPTWKQARWLELSLYVFWREHVNTVFWYLVRDQPPPYTINYASGVYFRNGKRKPSFTAYRFPLVVRRYHSSARIWGISPLTGTVRVQRQVGGSWRTVATFRRRARHVFARRIPRRMHGHFRAVIRGQKSLTWKY